jgi:hypothetical protein
VKLRLIRLRTGAVMLGSRCCSGSCVLETLELLQVGGEVRCVFVSVDMQPSS